MIKGLFFSQSFGKGSNVTQFAQPNQDQAGDMKSISADKQPHNQNFISMLKNCLGASEEKGQQTNMDRQKDSSFNMIVPTQNQATFNPKDSIVNQFQLRKSDNFIASQVPNKPTEEQRQMDGHKMSFTTALLGSNQMIKPQTNHWTDGKPHSGEAPADTDN